MFGCRKWIRDKDNVAAFRCGDNTSNGTIFCDSCKNKLQEE